MDDGYRTVFPAALNLEGRSVLVVGGDHEAEEKSQKLLRAGCFLSVVAPEVTAALGRWARQGRLSWYARPVCERDLLGRQLVLLSEPHPDRARWLRQQKSRYGYWLCTVDQPQFSDVLLVSTVIRGPVQIGVSTGGGAPLLARRLRQALEAGLDAKFVHFASVIARARASLRHLPKPERTARLNALLSGFAMDLHVSYPESEAGVDHEV